MPKLALKWLIAVFSGWFIFNTITWAEEREEYLTKAQEAVAELETALKAELETALSAGGMAGAIKICAEKATGIASQISRRTGWSVRRVSQKLRNPLNRPDEYEYSILKEFEKQAEKDKAENKDMGLERYDLVIIQGVKEFRYLKAITLKPVCVKCHGKPEEIAEEVKAELDTGYPHDQATGYAVGQVRGAFSVRIPVK